MTFSEINITIEEVEKLCQLYQDSQLSVLEETELEYVLMHCDYDSPIIGETKELMTISHSIKLMEIKQPHKHLWTWAMRVAASMAIMFGTIALFRQISLNAESNDCIVYVAGERASDKDAHKIAETDVVKMQRFIQVVNKQKTTEQAKVEKFMNHINLSK